ncbi:hypothetical protein ACFPN1_16105 [Lysobacter yangpyeongensis]|jgi:hypothetical protein|uniref:Uncharacterized protein n=1 Tax=Lysobacter yangpyeongensis TaxID=346182 RepID=A0ABW0SS70_9GAMM
MANGSDQLQEKVLASGLMTMAAGKSSAVIDSFVSWLIAGAGGAIALVIGNLPGIGQHLDVAVVSCASIIYLIAAGLTVVEKFLAAVVMGAAESASQAKDFIRDLPPDGNLDMEVVFREFESATFRPMRWFMSKSFAKVRSGDFTASAKNFARCAQIQAFLALAATGLVFWALGLIISGLDG